MNSDKKHLLKQNALNKIFDFKEVIDKATEDTEDADERTIRITLEEFLLDAREFVDTLSVYVDKL